MAWLVDLWHSYVAHRAYQPGPWQEFWPMPDTIKAKDSTSIAETLENYFLSGWGMGQVTGNFRFEKPAC